MKEILCPLCNSNKIKLTDIGEWRINGLFGEERASSVRLYCLSCKKAMTITGALVSTIEKVKK